MLVRLVAAPLVAISLLVLPASATAQSGIGDAYVPQAGNPGYDVRHYSVGVRYWPATGRLRGDTTVRLMPTTRLRSFSLDLLLRAETVRIDGSAVSFTQSRHELTIHPATALPQGTVVAVRVRYHGKPSQVRYQGEQPVERTRTGAIAVGEPAIAAWWFPSNDHPRDKARFDLALTVPRGYEGVSNGQLLGHHSSGQTTTWRWRASSPMATYLAFAAFGQYQLQQGMTAAGVPYVYAWERGLGPKAKPARRSLRFTPQAVRFLTHAWGRYPFTSLGGVVPDVALGYALENQTRPVYGRDMFGRGVARSLIVHELAHQWFGDRVSLRRWQDIWLNEGLATYSEWLWEAHRGGRSPQQQLMRHYNLFEASSRFWQLKIGDPGRGRLFDDAVYDRGAMTVQALRNRVGSHDFFVIAKRWTHAGDGVGSTRELRRLAERVSGQQLRPFFHHWLYVGTKPARTAQNGLQVGRGVAAASSPRNSPASGIAAPGASE
jgi:aminopeptidase N